MKLHKKSRLSFNILIVCIAAFLICSCFYFVSVRIATSYIYNSVEKNKTRQKEQDKKAEEFREYIKEKNVKLTDKEKISQWSNKQKYLYLKIIKKDNLVFDSVSNSVKIV